MGTCYFLDGTNFPTLTEKNVRHFQADFRPRNKEMEINALVKLLQNAQIFLPIYRFRDLSVSLHYLEIIIIIFCL